MSLAEPARALASPAAGIGARYRLGPMIAITWLAVTAAAMLRGTSVLDAMSTDDFMRLAMVRDLLAGQGWFDLTQYRLDPPAGVAMHWSRIADLPVAALILALTPLVGRDAAELAAVAAWPTLLFLPVLALAAAIAGRLGGKTAALMTIPLVAVSMPVVVHFRPGGIDHHGLQLLLLLAATAGAMERERRLPLVVGGLAAAASLAVGLEMLPAIVAILAAVGLRWAIEGGAAARTASDFGFAFATGAAILFAVTVPVSGWNAPVCDAFSAPWLVAAWLSGGALVLLACATSFLERRPARLAAGIVAGATAIGIFAFAFPACLGSPYVGLDPRMAELWLENVHEAQGIGALMRNMPDKVLPFYGPPLAALMLGGIVLHRARPSQRFEFLPPMLVLFVLTAVTLWQVRGAAAANLFAQVVFAVALVRLIGEGSGWRSGLRLLAVLAAISGPTWILAGHGMSNALAAFGPARPVIVQDNPGTCRQASDLASLQALPSGLVLSFVDLGPAILAQTPHSILAAPYHRNGAGNSAAFDMLLADDDAAARQALLEKQVHYIAVCPRAPERFRYQQLAPAGLAARIARGEVPPYLEVLPTDSAASLRVFRVRR